MNLVSSSSNLPVVLASSSVVRKKILTDIGISFICESPEFLEEEAKQSLIIEQSKNNLSINIKKIALELAIGKARSLNKKYDNHLIIGSDQICEFKGNIINKSNSAEEAINQLQMMSNDIHLQHNAVAIILNNKIIFRKSTTAKMWLNQLSLEQIKLYVDIDKPWGCAGSYKYESLGKHLFKKVEGDYYSILGLAIQPVISFLHQNKFLNINQFQK